MTINYSKPSQALRTAVAISIGCRILQVSQPGYPKQIVVYHPDGLMSNSVNINDNVEIDTMALAAKYDLITARYDVEEKFLMRELDRNAVRYSIAGAKSSFDGLSVWQCTLDAKGPRANAFAYGHATLALAMCEAVIKLWDKTGKKLNEW